MPSLFQRLFGGAAVEERAADAKESEGRIEPAGRVMVEIARIDPESGVVSTGALPSAAETLAAIFAPETDAPPQLATAVPVEPPAASPTKTPSAVTAESAIDAAPNSAMKARVETANTPIPNVSKPKVARPPAPSTHPPAAANIGPIRTGHSELHADQSAVAPHKNSPSDSPADKPVAKNNHSAEAAGTPPANKAPAASVEQSQDEPAADGHSPAAGLAPERAPSEHLRPEPIPPSRDWPLEEKLASHREWLDTKGMAGEKADLSDTDLEGSELIGVHLRFADLHDANLRAADLLLADLRGACLVRADLEDSCLVGANLEGANLEGASVETAMGLVPRQLAGANLRDALLPPQVMEFEAAGRFEKASQMAWRYFGPLLVATLVSWLMIWKTKDAQLLTDSAVVPYFHSHAAASALPSTQIFLLTPLVLLALYLAFQFHLQRLWDSVLELPAIFPDGHPLDDRGPAVIVGLLRAHFPWINQDASSTRLVEKGAAILIGYWAVPVTLLLFWARYLTLQDLRGAILQALLVVIASGVALHATTKTGRPMERWAIEEKWTHRMIQQVKGVHAAKTSICLAGALLFLSFGTVLGAPHDLSRAPQYGAANIRRWAPDVLWMVGFDPYANITEASLSRRPVRWTGADDQLGAVDGPRLNSVRFRYAQGYGVFLANAHLWHTDLQGAFLSDADLRGTDFGQSNLRFAILDGAHLYQANLNRANLDSTDLARADIRGANLSYASLANANLLDARLDGATLYNVNLMNANLSRASLARADLRGSSLNSARMEHADLQQAYLWSAKLPAANLYGAKLGGAILIAADLRGADLREAQFAGTVLNDADLTGAKLDNADLRGALGLGASQVCSAATRSGALMDEAMAMQVYDLCGGVRPVIQAAPAGDVAP
jgi:uncharacterized protein YjbI with pentapeptide repeats